ncbi:MAG TPA: hypothetical protein QGG59_10115 [Planctomycetota bacterium]|nr:hypothetical protein [Planctomycetota bacterium]
MSTVGKLFVVVNLVLAGLFVGASASLIGTSQEYRAKFESEQSAHQESVRASKEEIDSLQGQVDGYELSDAAKASELKSRDADNQDLRTRLEASEQKASDFSATVDQYNSKLDDLVQANRDVSDSLRQANKDLANAKEERDDALDAKEKADAAQSAAETGRQTAQDALANLESALHRATRDAEDAKSSLSKLANRFGVSPNKIGEQPDINGVVNSVSYDGDMPIVVISVGDDESVRAGYTFDVWNGHQYKGEIRVEVVNATNSACTIQTNGDFRIKANDRFATSL